MIHFFKKLFKRDNRTLDSKAMEWWVSRTLPKSFYLRLYYREYAELNIPEEVYYYSDKALNEYKLTDEQILLLYKLEHGIQ
jgi:hypothetical protein